MHEKIAKKSRFQLTFGLRIFVRLKSPAPTTTTAATSTSPEAATSRLFSSDHFFIED
jgi:hypothetical protein